MRKHNCAIYVRKSTEKGLELEFNSLHNQEEACKNYILSQAFNGWEYYKTYSDGGLSGGSTDRPSLQHMLKDMAKGLIQTVVVYKVDRLSRSILDFHTMMKTFEDYNCNFVSITQSFDTSTSMGKLTLNMLLSFAQFEREVSSERVKDKIHAQKAKGFWTGGIPRLGYDIEDKKLVINEKEAEIVKEIFGTYLELGSVAELVRYLRKHTITHKKWVTATGKERGGAIMGATSVHRFLRDKIYIGCIENKLTNEVFTGQHVPILSKEVFEAVQEQLKDNTSNKKGHSPKTSNLLTGKLFTSTGILFTNQATSRKGTITNRYYATKGFYVPASQVDKVTESVIRDVLRANVKELNKKAALCLKQINFDLMEYSEKRKVIRTLINKVIYAKNKLTFFLQVDPIELYRFTDATYLQTTSDPMELIIHRDKNQIIVEKDIYFTKGHSTTSYNAGKTGLLTITDNHHLLVRAFAYAWKYKRLYEEGLTAKAIAEKECASLRTIYKYLNLAYLSPRIVNALLSGKISVPIHEIYTLASKSTVFSEQERLFFTK